MKKVTLLSLSFITCLTLVACSQKDIATVSSTSKAEVVTTTVAKSADTTYQATEIPENTYGKYSENDIDYTYDESKSTLITLSDTTADITGEGASLKDNILTISKEGTYVLSGNFKGQIKVDSNDSNVQIVLNNASITSTDGPGILVTSAKNVYITLAQNSENSITDSKNYTLEADSDEPDAAIYSKSDLTINGLGKLDVTANYSNGIRGKDDVIITGGKITIKAKNNGLKGKDSVSILNGLLNITTEEGDGIQSNNSEDVEKGWMGIDGGEINLVTGSDGIQAETTLSAQNTILSVASTDTDAEKNDELSQKGLKATGNIILDSGTYTVNTVDDSIHSNSDVTINNGTYQLSSQDDGIHSDGNLILNDGEVTIEKSYEGLEGKTIQIKGGSHIVNASDDGINASDPEASSSEGGMPGGMGGSVDSSVYLAISGGTTIIKADGDGADSNGNVTMTDGVLIVEGPTNGGNGALDYDGTWEQSGGTLLALGTQDMAMTPSESSSQYSLGLFLDNTESGSVTIQKDDTTLFSYTPSKSYNHIAVSSPELSDNASISILLGGTIEGDAVNNYVANSTVSNTETVSTYTLTSSVTSLSQDGEVAQTMGMGGGFGGGEPPR